MRIITLVMTALVLAGTARALELSLEENRTQKGSVGYVDMQRVFSESPDSAAAKESFEEIVRGAEERVNLKRAELLKLRQELAAAKAERERLSKEAAVPPPAAAPAAGAGAVGTLGAFTPPAHPAQPASTAPAAGAAPTASTAPVGALPLATLLGLPAANAPLAPPAVAASTSAAAAAADGGGRGRRYRDDSLDAAVAASTRAVAASTATVSASTAAAAVAAPSRAAAAVAPPVVATSTAPLTGTAAIASRVLDLDNKIIALQATILRQEEALTRERSETDKGLVSIEGRKTDQVLVKIYAAITAVAHQEGVSIVVDRSTILYGHQGVDLTDKVLQYLRSPAQP